ncbi:hypothetical protein ACHAXA_011327 [Cyclostephanos tholiformis]|uniref:mRNA (guanine-N(7))-methyltransferase n=1 Tax=Cyclostephanos tholiformis TaxID=382380 RepID=A0ABD3REU4_9STRA
MVYPTTNPTAKHDILCPASFIDAISNHRPGTIAIDENRNVDVLGGVGIVVSDIESLASAMALQPATTSNDVRRASTIYTYPDAPIFPKPISRAPRICRLVDRVLFDRSTTTTTTTTTTTLSGWCTIAVKRPSCVSKSDLKSIENARSFRNLMIFLRDRKLVAMLASDSAGRICFVVPDDDTDDYENNDDAHCAARLYYAPLGELITSARANHDRANDERQNPQRRRKRDQCDVVGTVEEDEPETWTPRYTPPPEEECAPRGWDNNNPSNSSVNDNKNGSSIEHDEPASWTPQYTPPPEEECHPRYWSDHDIDGSRRTTTKVDDDNDDDYGMVRLFVPPAAGTSSNDGNAIGDHRGDDVGAGLWGWNNDADITNTSASAGNDNGGWDALLRSNAMAVSSSDAIGSSVSNGGGAFHANSGAAAADAFYSNLTRSLDTRADSRLLHMRNFNGWVKATQIAELDPDTSSRGSSSGKKRSRLSPLRVLDLACGKGGDLGKWIIHPRKVENYVGVDVARGSLADAALRARQMSKSGKSNALRRCTFTLADLGEDVPGRKRSGRARRMQKLLTWNLQNETSDERDRDPSFVAREGGGIAVTDKFDVVSIQFAIHYMMSTRKRARRFFNTVSSLLEIGGNLIATTIDARVVVEKLMALGLDYHFDDLDVHPDVNTAECEEGHRNANPLRKVRDDEGVTLLVGEGVCRLKFDSDTLHRVFRTSESPEDMFGLQYTFTLVEGSDHAAGVGEAVDLPEWLTPIAALEKLAEEFGLKLEYATNFHEFYEERKNPAKFPMAHNALYNMKVLNRNGSISDQEWDVSRMYIALKFCKVSESNADLGDEDVTEDEMRE